MLAIAKDREFCGNLNYNQSMATKTDPIYNRFRGFLPVVIDLETGGTNAEKNPILEIAAVFVQMNENGLLTMGQEFCEHIIAFNGSQIDKESLEINRIDPDYPLRFPLEEKKVLQLLIDATQKELKATNCKRAILVGHNAHFDLAFLQRAIERCQLRDKSPFHRFSVLDTVSLAALAYGQTILSLACQRGGIGFNAEEAHSALYDARKTAELFCQIVNNWLYLGGWDERTGISSSARNKDNRENRENKKHKKK